MENLKYIDEDDALKRLNGNKRLFLRLLNMFLENKDFASLEENVEKKEYAKAAESAHTIKGVAGNLGMPILFEISSDLMVELKEGNPEMGTISSYRVALLETQKETRNIIDRLNSELKN